MPWTTPTAHELRMDAEIGGYQGDDPEPEDPPIVEPCPGEIE